MHNRAEIPPQEASPNEQNLDAPQPSPTTQAAPPERTTPAQIPIQAIALDSIIIDEQQLRNDIDDDGVIELALDIKRNGLLQPIGVRPTSGGRFQLLFGSRRLAAHFRLREPTILARIFPAQGDTVKAIALRENVLRTQLSLTEECNAVAYLHFEENKSPDQIADLVGKGRQWVLRRLAIPQLPDDLRIPLYDGAISVGAAETIARLDDPSARAYLIAHTAAHKPSIAQLRVLVETFAAAPSITDAVKAGEEAHEQTTALGPPKFDCHTCDTPTELARLVIIRVCPACAPYLKSAATDHAPIDTPPDAGPTERH